jgi:hypothetical protein
LPLSWAKSEVALVVETDATRASRFYLLARSALCVLGCGSSCLTTRNRPRLAFAADALRTRIASNLFEIGFVPRFGSSAPATEPGLCELLAASIFDFRDRFGLFKLDGLSVFRIIA